MGASQTVASALLITLPQHNFPKTMIGLVMSINTLTVMGIRPLWAFTFWALANLIGTSAAPAAGALIAAAIVVYILPRIAGCALHNGASLYKREAQEIDHMNVLTTNGTVIVPHL